MDLIQYRQHIRTLAKRRDGQPVYNESVDHAAVVVEYLFASAAESVDILTGNLNPRVYGRAAVVREAEFFLLMSPKSKIRIIMEEDPGELKERHPLLVALGGFKDRVKLRIAPDIVRRRYDFHFIVTDNDNYRFESDKKQPAAIAAFGHPQGGRNLRSQYSTIWNMCPEPS